MTICGDTASAHGLTYVCHGSAGHSGDHRDHVLGASWPDGGAPR